MILNVLAVLSGRGKQNLIDPIVNSIPVQSCTGIRLVIRDGGQLVVTMPLAFRTLVRS